MSYPKFLDDLNDFYKDRHERGLKDRVSLEEAQNVVRDQWLRDGRHQELISFILENWDSGNCDDFMNPLLETLIRDHDSRSYKRLWRGVLRHRIEKARSYYSYLKSELPTITIDELDQVNLANFSEFSSREPLLRRTAYTRRFALQGIDAYIAGLHNFPEQESEIDWAEELHRNVTLLQKRRPKPTTDRRKIDIDIFWELIELSRRDGTNQFEFLDNLTESLEAFSATEIRKFQKLLLSTIAEIYTQEHWALAFIVRRGCGDDEFDYFRAWAVSLGRESFAAIKRIDLEHLKTIFTEDPQLEPLLYLAQSAYEQKTSEIMKEIRIRKPKLTGKQWDEKSVERVFPELCELLNYQDN